MFERVKFFKVAMFYIEAAVEYGLDKKETIEAVAEILDDMFEFKIELIEANDKVIFVRGISALYDLFTKHKVKANKAFVEHVELGAGLKRH